MKKGGNANHPQKGSTIKVEPIRKLQDIKALKTMLGDQARNMALFVVGINTNLRASDLLALTVDQVAGLKPMDEIEIREKKTGKARRVSLNKACIAAIDKWLVEPDAPKWGEYLFKSRRGDRLTVSSVHRLVKGWCRDINLQGNYGSHTLRKTWGYHQRVTFGMGLPELMVAFNHSTQKQTLDYLCIQPEEIKSIYANVL